MLADPFLRYVYAVKPYTGVADDAEKTKDKANSIVYELLAKITKINYDNRVLVVAVVLVEGIQACGFQLQGAEETRGARDSH